MDEVLQLLLVHVGPEVGAEADDAAVAIELLQSRRSVQPGLEAEVAGGLVDAQRATPAQEVQQLGGEERETQPAQRLGRDSDRDRRQERRVPLACRVQQPGQGQRP